MNKSKTRVIDVVRGFTLTRDDDTPQVFSPGQHTVEEEIAEHWYVKIHLRPAAEPKLGDLAYYEALDAEATKAEAAAAAQRRLANEALNAYRTQQQAAEEEGEDEDDKEEDDEGEDDEKQPAPPSRPVRARPRLKK